MPVPRHQQVVIALSLAILHDAEELAAKQRVDTLAVRLALRCLLPLCPEQWPLTQFWRCAGQESDNGRSQGCHGSLNGIIRQLARTGHAPQGVHHSLDLKNAVYVREIRSTKGAPKSARGRALMKAYMAAGREPDGTERR